jgi:malonate transporter
MNVILDIVMPVFGMVAVGYVLGRTLLSPEGVRGLVNVTFYALFPALLFRSTATVRLDALDPAILLVFFGAVILLYFLMMPLGRALGMNLGEQTIFALSGTFSNGVGIGIPFVAYAFGPDGLVPLLMIISLHSLIMLTLASFMMEIATQGSSRRLLAKLGSAAFNMLKHPVIPPIILGLMWAELAAQVPGLAIPRVIDQILMALGTAAAPCGLIMTGASLAHVGLRGNWQTAALASVFKLSVLPVLVWLVGRYVFPLDPLWLTVATLNSALPAGTNVYMIAQLYGAGVGRATNAVVISTAASVATLTVALLLLDVHTR